MVDVSQKPPTERTAEAYAEVLLGRKAFRAVLHNAVQKGDVLAAARLAGIQAAKKTSELIPLCHNIFLTHAGIELTLNKKNFSVEIVSSVTTISVTGVEMEALTAASVAALTVYDMCKAIDKSITIHKIHLRSKTGGKSGTYHI